MTALLIVLYVIAAGLTGLLLVEKLDERLDRRFPSYARAWARAFGEPAPQASHVRPLDSPVRTHRPCLACHCEGFHDEGCSHLDRLDAGEVHR